MKITLDVESFINTVEEKVNNTIKTAILSNRSYGNMPNRRIKLCYIPSDEMKSKSSQQDSTSVLHQKMNESQVTPGNNDSSQGNRDADSNTFDNNDGFVSMPSRKRLSIELGSPNNYNGDGQQEQASIRNSATSAGNGARRMRPRHSLASTASFDNSSRLSEVSNDYPTSRSNSILDSVDRIGLSNGNSADLVRAAVDRARLQELESTMNSMTQNSFRNSFGANGHYLVGSNSMASAAEAVRLAEMTNQLDSIGTRHFGDASNLNLYNAFSNINQPRQDDNLNEIGRLLGLNQRLSGHNGGLLTTDTYNLESMQQAELEAAIHYLHRGPSGVDQTPSSIADLASFLEPDNGNFSAARRRSSYNREVAAMENVLSALRRRSSAGNSMAVAAEAARMADIESAMRQRFTSRPSIAAAAEAIRMAELEASIAMRRRDSRNSIGQASVNSVAAAAEVVRMAEADNIRNVGRQSFTLQDEETLNSITRRTSAGGNNFALAAAAAEIQRLTDLECNNLYQNRRNEQSQRARQTRVSFRLDNMNNFNGMNRML